MAKKNKWREQFLKDAEEFNKKYNICNTCNGSGEVEETDQVKRKKVTRPCRVCVGKGYYPKN